MKKEVIFSIPTVVINMKTLIIFLLFTSNISFAQMIDSNMNELKDKLLIKERFMKFIQNEFDTYNISKIEAIAQNHFLSIQNFNRTVKDKRITYHFFGLPVEKIFSFYKNQNEGAVYMLINIDYQKLKNFVDVLGIPENTTKDDFEKGDFEIVVWRWNGLEISILHSFITDKSNQSRIVTISHVNDKMDLINLMPPE